MYIDTNSKWYQTYYKTDDGIQSIHSAEATLVGIELCPILKKGQHVNSENAFAFEQFYALAA